LGIAITPFQGFEDAFSKSDTAGPLHAVRLFVAEEGCELFFADTAAEFAARLAKTGRLQHLRQESRLKVCRRTMQNSISVSWL
jgi:hypothetical protein